MKTSKKQTLQGTGGGAVDVISGGFPCQPFSVAGKRRGAADDRFLWPEMLRAIREVQPAWVVAENVSGLLTQQRGVVFERVCAELEGEGYEVQPLIIPASAVGAPHRRNRVWIIAHRADTVLEGVQGRKNGVFEPQAAPHANGKMQKRRHEDEQKSSGIAEFDGLGGIGAAPHAEGWREFPTQPPVCGRDDGIPGRLDGITFSKWRRKSIKALGNAIVPQVAYKIFKAIMESKIAEARLKEALGLFP